MSKTKKIFLSFILLLPCCIFILVTYKGIKTQKIELSSLKRITGQVIDVGETERKSRRLNSTVFFVQLNNLEQKFGVYRMNKNYETLLNNIYNGDTLTLYYIDNKSNEINIDLVQIDKDKLIILDKEEYIKKESSLIWIGLFGSIFSILNIIRFLKKDLSEKPKSN